MKLREDLVQRCLDVGLGFRIESKGEIDKEVSLMLDYPLPTDKVVELNGIRFYLDPVSADTLGSFELDYLETPEGGFCLKGREGTG